MTQGKRAGFSAAQKTDIWSRWKAGQSLHMIVRGPIAFIGVAFRTLEQRRRSDFRPLSRLYTLPARSPYSDSGEVSAKEDNPQLLLRARACGNVKNLSLLTGYTVGGRRPAVMNMFP